MLASNRELSCLVVIGSREPQVQTIEVHDFFMPYTKVKFWRKKHEPERVRKSKELLQKRNKD